MLGARVRGGWRMAGAKGSKNSSEHGSGVIGFRV